MGPTKAANAQERDALAREIESLAREVDALSNQLLGLRGIGAELCTMKLYSTSSLLRHARTVLLQARF